MPEEPRKFLVIDEMVVGYGTEAALVSEAANYDSDYEILGDDELSLDQMSVAATLRDMVEFSTVSPLDTEENAIIGVLEENDNLIDAMEEEKTEAELGSPENPMTREQAEEAGIDTEAAIASAETVETPDETENDGGGSEEAEPASEPVPETEAE